MKNTLKWRLGKLPTSDEVRELVKADLITKEEARDILFNEQTEEDVEVDNLKAEIKFLRETVEKLADKGTIKTVIQEIIPRYIQSPIYYPYYYWSGGGVGINTYCTTGSALCAGGTTTLGNATWTATGGSGSINCSATNDIDFTDIQTY